MAFRKVIWSPVEEEYLLKHLKDPVNQLTIALAKSRSAIQKKVSELSGKNKTTKGKKSTVNTFRNQFRDDLGLRTRSLLEANILRYLKYQGIKYQYEPTVFHFQDIKRGKVSYTPDIYLPNEDLWIEVKGRLWPGDAGKLKNFKKFYPAEFSKLRYITRSKKSKATEHFIKSNIPLYFYYDDINKKFRDVIPHWESYRK